jgi:hypothetical protein
MRPADSRLREPETGRGRQDCGMIDKRFVSGAILAVTIVVAGASSLPALLLRPAAPDPLPMPAIAPAILKTAEPIERAEGVEAKPVVIARIEPKPVAEREPPVSVAPPQAVLRDPPVPDPPPAPVAAKPVAIPSPPPAAPAAEPSAPVREAASVAFPPVQPVGVATASGPDTVVSPAAGAPARSARTAEKPRQRAAHQTATRKRSVRPAIFPLREFLAWRR